MTAILAEKEGMKKYEAKYQSAPPKPYPEERVYISCQIIY
jgi:hypothetical protein